MIANLQNYCNKRNSDGNFSRHHRFFAPYFLILEAKRIFLARYPSFCTIFRKKRAF
jgi:hypothetical protein